MKTIAFIVLIGIIFLEAKNANELENRIYKNAQSEKQKVAALEEQLRELQGNPASLRDRLTRTLADRPFGAPKAFEHCVVQCLAECDGGKAEAEVDVQNLEYESQAYGAPGFTGTIRLVMWRTGNNWSASRFYFQRDGYTYRCSLPSRIEIK